MCYARRQRSSWARIKLSNNCILNSFEFSIVIRALYLSFFYFCMSIYNSSLTRMYFALCFALYFSSCCSIFNDRFAALFRDSLTIISHLFRFVNTFFKTFLKNFRGFFKVMKFATSARFWGWAIILSQYWFFVKRFLKIFLFLYIFVFFGGIMQGEWCKVNNKRNKTGGEPLQCH